MLSVSLLSKFKIFLSMCLVFTFLGCESEQKFSTIALWTFDEQIGIYPSCVLSDMSENDFPLVIGP